MSELREAVMRSVLDQMTDGSLEWPRSVPQLERMIDAAIAAMRAHQPEPTEAEVDAGAVALHDFTQEPSGQDRPWAVFPAEYHDLFRERARVVLIAARNAGQED